MDLIVKSKSKNQFEGFPGNEIIDLASGITSKTNSTKATRQKKTEITQEEKTAILEISQIRRAAQRRGSPDAGASTELSKGQDLSHI